MNWANEIKTRVKMPALVRFYGLKLNQQGRTACPFHGGKNPNLGVKEDFCHCFKCGYNADAIKFVQDFFGMSFQDAIAKLNDDFSLGLPIGQKVDKRRQLFNAKENYERKLEHKRQQEAIESLRERFYNALGEFERLDKNRLIYQPKAGEELHPLFVEALQKIDEAQYELFCAEEDWKNAVEGSPCGNTAVHG